jgi:meso-butanediol dehydrogenase/(S,S)-butanediol dehydrogenase/diacetyl reductase
MAATAKFDYTGQVVLITGGGSGIGRDMADAFIAAGATVMICGRRIQPLEDFSSTSPNASHMRADITNDEDRRALIDGVISRHGRLDVLINNAFTGPDLLKPFMDQTWDGIMQQIEPLFIGPIALCKAALPHLVKTKGNIINISSANARSVHVPSQGRTLYGACKAGLEHFTRNLAVDMGPDGVRVNVLGPGATVTPDTQGFFERNPAFKQSIIERTPLGRFGQGSDIADVALFLGSDAARWLTGEVIYASGGYALSR